jgi:glycosyltransferase involved in cell wall biosynthesis
MDVFAFPAILEGTSNAILEAMASGLPVIAADSGGNRELVVEGETGFLFPVGDEQGMGELIVDLMQDGDKRCAMGLAARQRVEERFTVQQMVADMERVYLEELGKIR